MFDLRAVVAIVILYKPVVEQVLNVKAFKTRYACTCLIANESSRVGWLLIANWFL